MKAPVTLFFGRECFNPRLFSEALKLLFTVNLWTRTCTANHKLRERAAPWQNTPHIWIPGRNQRQGGLPQSPLKMEVKQSATSTIHHRAPEYTTSLFASAVRRLLDNDVFNLVLRPHMRKQANAGSTLLSAHVSDTSICYVRGRSQCSLFMFRGRFREFLKKRKRL